MLNQKRNLKIAFVNPPHADWSLANNAAYLMFQSHYKRFGKNVERVEWLNAPYKFNKYLTIEDIYNDGIQDADIYLFSSYVWNYDILDELASYVKSKNPNAVCVLGGPQIGTNDPELLSRRTMYDFILKPTKPGEVFVQELIDSYLDNDGNINYQDLSWELRSNKTCIQFMPDYSIYEEHIDFLIKTNQYAKQNKLEPFIIIETTRGCPYQCSFCEWGGGIGSKIYKKPLEIVKKDILSLKSSGYRDVYLTDANFGAFLERDLEIFKFAFKNGVNLTDISTMKSKDLKRRIELVDSWFNVVGAGPEKHSQVSIKQEGGYALIVGSYDMANLVSNDEPMYISVIPTVSIQSVSEVAMKIANRVDLSLENKIKLSKHIYTRCHEEGYPVPAPELIMAMPGSTLEDFYKEFEIFWNFKAWNSHRHDYMFLPDAQLSSPSYLEKYNISLVEVYTDLVDEDGVDNIHGLYQRKKHHFKTISSCFSFTTKELCEMAFMNIAGNWLLKEMYESFQNDTTPANFGKISFEVIKDLKEFQDIWQELLEIYTPNNRPRNVKRLQGKLRNIVVNNFLEKNRKLIYSEVFRLIDAGKSVFFLENKIDNKDKVIPIVLK
jgi:hypothetical protein